jgi:hypothetical protein
MHSTFHRMQFFKKFAEPFSKECRYGAESSQRDNCVAGLFRALMATMWISTVIPLFLCAMRRWFFSASMADLGPPSAFSKRGGTDMNIHQEAAKNATEDQAGVLSEKSLWVAVLLQALEDWGSSNSRHREEADRFFFGCPEDFARVCRGAGLAPCSVLTRLQKMKAAAPPRRQAFPFNRAA